MVANCHVERIEYFRHDSEHLALPVRHICENNGETFTHGTRSDAQPQLLDTPPEDGDPWRRLVEPVTIPSHHVLVAVGRNITYLAELGRGTTNTTPLLTWQDGYATTHAPRDNVDTFLNQWFTTPVRNLLDTQLTKLATTQHVDPLVEAALNVVTSSVAVHPVTRTAYEMLVAGLANDEDRMELAELRCTINTIDSASLVLNLVRHLNRLLQDNMLSPQDVATLLTHPNSNLSAAAAHVI